MSTSSKIYSPEDVVLMALFPPGGVPHTPAQVQKLLFLLDRNLGDLLGGPKFNFEPYHYGPFDRCVYFTLEDLADQGLVEITQNNGGWCDFRLTPDGQILASQLLAGVEERARSYIERVSAFVRSLSFTDLVAAIYKAYPEMRVRGVFQDVGSFKNSRSEVHRMAEPYLEVTFRRGRAFAAYLYLPRQADEKSASTKRVEPGLVIDFGPSGNPIGIEITAPDQISLETINHLLEELGLPPVAQADLAPVLAS